MVVSRDALFRALDLKYRRERMPAIVVGAVNGIMTIQVDGETQNIEHFGVESITPGTHIWVRQTGAGNNALERYEFAGVRSQAGSTNQGVPQGIPPVHPDAISQYIDPLIERIQVLEDFINTLIAGHIIYDGGTPMPQRSILVFQGAGVSVVDNSVEDKTVITIAGGGTAPTGNNYNEPINYNAPTGYNG